MIEVVQAPWSDLEHLAENLRDEDLVETVLLTGKDPERALIQGWNTSTDVLSVQTHVPDPHGFTVLLGMCGVQPIEGTQAANAWLLCTPEVERHSLSALKVAPRILDRLSTGYPGGLVSQVWRENEMHAHWAEACGFQYYTSTVIRGNEFLILNRPHPDTPYTL
jgi:hypothetical protein